METTRDRVELLVIDSNLTKTRFAALAGIDPANFAKKLKGVLAFTIKDLEKISAYTGANFNWLLQGEGSRGDVDYKKKEEDSGTPFYNVDFMAGFMEAFVERRDQPLHSLQPEKDGRGH